MSCGVPLTPRSAVSAAISRRASSQASGRDHQGLAVTMRRIAGRCGALEMTFVRF
jgi:hypothetical protein